MAPPIKRQTAYKIWISSLTSGTYIKQEGWNPNYIEVNGKQISRVNLLATVVSKFSSEDGNYATITLDDGSDTIRCKAFGPDVFKIKEVKIGGVVRFVGKVREYNEEIHLSPEIVKIINDPNWVLVRRLELGKPIIQDKLDAEPQAQKTSEKKIDESVEVEVISEENLSTKVLEIIKGLDKENGADIKKVIEESKLEEEDAKNVIVGLLKSGDIFEPKKGFLKILE